ncbi:MAG: DUF1906 domain-containing protein [Geminicoccaceae bacterium]
MLDTTKNCAPAAARLLAEGCHTVIRYYSRSDWKRVTQAEAHRLGSQGLRLAAVYQNRQTQVADFDRNKGEAAGRHAYDYAQNTMFQPPGSAIYFSVDYDATGSEITGAVIPYFEGVRQAFVTLSGGNPDYRVGVYGSGRTCRILADAGLVSLTWLAQARGWAEYDQYSAGNRWALRQGMPVVVAGIEGDPNDTNPAVPDFGAFLPEAATLGPIVEAAGALPHLAGWTVNARDGLRLRAGPGASFETRRVLPFGMALSLISLSGDWALVDLNGDGAADGFCHSAFLKAA